MIFKLGQKVRIPPLEYFLEKYKCNRWEDLDAAYLCGWTESMNDVCGTILEIKDKLDEEHYSSIHAGRYSWMKEDLKTVAKMRRKKGTP